MCSQQYHAPQVQVTSLFQYFAQYMGTGGPIAVVEVALGRQAASFEVMRVIFLPGALKIQGNSKI